MKIGMIIAAVCLLFVFIATDPMGLWTCRYPMEARVRTESVSNIKNAWNLLTCYASDHSGCFPEAYDMKFLNDCVAADYFTMDEIDNYRAGGAQDGETGYALVPNLVQASRGSRILLITKHQVTEDRFTIVAVSGKAECVPTDEALEKLAATLADESWEPRAPEE